MYITVRKSQRRGWKWEADIRDLPGSPTVGLGSTKEAAVADAFRQNLYLECYQPILIKIAKDSVVKGIKVETVKEDLQVVR
jgi:hypothetical protein